MPELPEIERLVRELRSTVVGKRIVDVAVRQPRMLNRTPEQFRSSVRGFVRAVRRVGKHLVLDLPEGELWLHLGLRGEMRYVGPETPWPQGVLALRFDDGAQLYLDRLFMGRAQVIPREEAAAQAAKFGVDPLDPSFTPERLADILRQRPSQPVKAVLMDQARLAGIGNTYADEILFEAGIRPTRLVKALSADDIRRLHAATRRVLSEASELGGEIVDLWGNPGRWENRVHGRERCPRCGTSVETVEIGGRTSYYCPRCQT